MPDLPKITEDFSANPDAYLEAIQAMINRTKELVAEVTALKTLIAELDGKNIEINIGGDWEEVLGTIKSEIEGLDGSTIRVNIIYSSNRPDIEKIQEQVTVSAPAGGTVPEKIAEQVTGAEQAAQAINEVTNATEKQTEATDVNIGKLKEQAAEFNEVAGAAETSREEMGLFAAANQVLGNALGDENVKLAQLKNALQSAVDAARLLRNSENELSDMANITAAQQEVLARAMGDTGLSAAQQKNAINAATEAQRELNLQARAAQQSADEEAASLKNLEASVGSTGSQFDQLSSRAQFLRDSISQNIAYTNLLKAAYDALALKDVEVTNSIRSLAQALDDGGGDSQLFVKGMAEGKSMMEAFGLAAKAAGNNVGGILIPLGAASFGITGLGTAIHLIVMGTFEFLAVFVPAMYAAAAGAAVMLQGVDNVTTHLSGLYTAAEALGPAFGKTAGDMVGLGHSLQTAQNLANPGVYELFGEAVIGVNNAFGKLNSQGLSTFGQLGLDVTHMLDTFGAKLDVEITQNIGKVNNILTNAVGDLVMFGQILGNIGHAILNLASAMPGLAEIVLKVIDGITQLIKWVSGLNPVFIAVVMGFEEAYRWSGLLVGVFGILGRAIALVGTLGIPVLAKIGSNFGSMAANILSGIAGMITNFGTMGAKLGILGEDAAKAGDAAVSGLENAATFMEGPWGAAIALGVAGFTALAIWALHSQTATEAWISSTQRAVTQATSLTALNVIGQQLAMNQQHLSSAQDALNKTMQTGGEIAQGVQGRYNGLSQTYDEQQGSVNALTQNQVKLESEAINVAAGAGKISQAYGVTFVSALGIASMAGVNLATTVVKFGKDANQAGLQIEAMVQGFNQMGLSGGTLANSMNAVNIQAGIQATKVSQVNQAWDSFIQMSTSLTGGFSQFNLDLQQMGNQAVTVGAKIQGFTGTTQLSVGQIASALKSFSGTSAQIWQAFNQSIQQANTFIDSLRTGMAAGAISSQQYTQSVASIVQQLIPYASKSQAALAEVEALAAEAGGPASGSLATLKGWVDKNAVSANTFTNYIDGMTVKLSNVTTIARNFAGTLQSDVAQAVANAAVNTSKITQLTDAYTQSLQTNGANASQTKTAQDALINALKAEGFSAQTAQQMTDILSTSYGKNQNAGNANMTQTQKTMQAQQDMANEINTNVVAALTNGSQSLTSTTNNHLKPMQGQIQGGNIVALDQMASRFSASLPQALGITNAASDNSKNAHLSPLQQLINAINRNTQTMIQTFKGWPSSEKTNVQLSASGGATIKSSVPGGGSGQVDVASTIGNQLAGGGVIPGYEPGHDSVPALLSKGEGILIPQAVRMLGGRDSIEAINSRAQHFATGGVAGWPQGFATGAFNSMRAGDTSFSDTFAEVLSASMKAVIKSAQNSLNAGTSIPVHGLSLSLVPYFTQAMALTGVPSSWLGDLETIAAYESGLNPNAINLSDSNAAAGDPSRGLMQTIMSTFLAYHQAGTSMDIYDPTANIAAAINYIKARYGSVFNVPGIVSLSHGGGYVGYDSGGLLMPGLTLAYNGTGQPETITPPGAGGGGSMVHTTINIDGKKVAEAISPALYQKASRQNGNGNASGYWAPGNTGPRRG